MAVIEPEQIDSRETGPRSLLDATDGGDLWTRDKVQRQQQHARDLVRMAAEDGPAAHQAQVCRRSTFPNCIGPCGCPGRKPKRACSM